MIQYLNTTQGTILGLLIVLTYTIVMMLIGAFIGYQICKKDKIKI